MAVDTPEKTRKPREAQYVTMTVNVRMYKTMTEAPDLGALLSDWAASREIPGSSEFAKSRKTGEVDYSRVNVTLGRAAVESASGSVPRTVLAPARAAIAALLESGVSGEEILARLAN